MKMTIQSTRSHHDNQLLSTILFAYTTTVLQIHIYQNALQPLNLVVADRFDGVSLLDDVHKSESNSEKLISESINVDKFNSCSETQLFAPAAALDESKYQCSFCV